MYCPLKAFTDLVTFSLPKCQANKLVKMCRFKTFKCQVKPVRVTNQKHTVYYALHGNYICAYRLCGENSWYVAIELAFLKFEWQSEAKSCSLHELIMKNL